MAERLTVSNIILLQNHHQVELGVVYQGHQHTLIVSGKKFILSQKKEDSFSTEEAEILIRKYYRLQDL